MIFLMKEPVGVSGGYHNGYHGFQGELDQGKPKRTLAPPTKFPPLPPLRSPLPLRGPPLPGGLPPPPKRFAPPSWWFSIPMRRITIVSCRYPTPKIMKS